MESLRWTKGKIWGIDQFQHEASQRWDSWNSEQIVISRRVRREKSRRVRAEILVKVELFAITAVLSGLCVK
jgi:hypothetical protein